MNLTQQDFDARVERAHAGVATDEDLRLIKHYRAEGYEQSDKSLAPAAEQNPPKDAGPGDDAGQVAQSRDTVAPGESGDKPGSKGGNADDGMGKASVSERRDAAGDTGNDVTHGFPTDRSTAAETSGSKTSKRPTR